MDVAEKIISAFRPFWEDEVLSTGSLSDDTVFPDFTFDEIETLVTASVEALSSSKALIEIPAPIVFVGDLHGNLHDLLKILHSFGVPPATRYIFLGDYVDRGDYSLHVISLILSFLLQFPDKVFLLRGNHEFSHINHAYGFYDEILATYGSDDLWTHFQEVFQWMPLAAIVEGSVFCVHGGLSPLLKNVETLRDLPMPIPNYLSNTMISDLVWSDPADTARGFQLNHRGSGQIFGPDAVEEFLKGNRLKLLIRAHQCTLSGFRAFANFMGITVFSSSNYCKTINNKCGVVVMKDDKEVAFYSLGLEDEVLMPRAIMYLPMEGDVGLKRMFRATSRPMFRGVGIGASASSSESDQEDQPPAKPQPFTRSQSVLVDLSNAT